MSPRAAKTGCLGLALVALMIGEIGCASSGPRDRAAADERAKERRRTVIMTTQDNVRVGREAAEQVAAQIGTLDDPELVAYVERIGKKLLRGLPRRDFAYRFAIVDQMEPNAFALPGGYIFVSRGLLALVNDEDELACVLGHEIIHAARRHSQQQQAVAASLPRLSLPGSRAKTLAAYGRDMEREADALGQRLAAAAGYDPMGMSTFMRRLDQRERLLIGAPRNPTFFDTHPGTRERARVNAMRSRELRWSRDPALGDTRKRLLDRIDGMVIGDRPETGIFLDDYFLHPALDFQIRFPPGWSTQNTARAVGAQSPRQDAVVFLTGDLPEGDLVEVADGFVAELAEDVAVDVREKKNVRLGKIEAVRYALEAGPAGRRVEAFVTFFPFAESTWRIVGASPVAAGNRYAPPILLSTRSFGPLDPARRAA
ncbi:MAG: M48 family metalloprotease, partial [Myxococcota bacterium]